MKNKTDNWNFPKPESPNGAFLNYQKKLMELMGQSGGWDQKDTWRGAAIKEFCRTFCLHRTNCTSALRVLDLVCRKVPERIDHWDIFRKWSFDHTIVTQPYHPFEKDEVDLLQAYRIEILDFSEWSWYYPGQAYCYGLFISDHARQLLKVGLNRTPSAQAKDVFRL